MQLAAATRGLREAEERTRDALEEAARSRAEADDRRARLEEAQEALRLAEQRLTTTHRCLLFCFRVLGGDGGGAFSLCMAVVV